MFLKLQIIGFQIFFKAKENNDDFVQCWGTGNPLREFLFVDDLASASIHIMNLGKEILQSEINPMCSHINVGTGKDLTIKELASKIKEVVGYRGELIFDVTKPDGTTASSFTSAPNVNSPYLISSTTLQTQLFRVIQVEEQDDVNYIITALSYVEGKYAFIENGTALPTRTISILFPVKS